jgi:predicted transcriptional regulator
VDLRPAVAVDVLQLLPEKLSVKFIMPSAATPESYQKAKNILGIQSEVRFAPEVKIGIGVNEKMGGICFCDLEGRIDYASGFIGYGPSFQQWCYDLFNYFWERASRKWPSGLAREVGTDAEEQRVVGEERLNERPYSS